MALRAQSLDAAGRRSTGLPVTISTVSLVVPDAEAAQIPDGPRIRSWGC